MGNAECCVLLCVLLNTDFVYLCHKRHTILLYMLNYRPVSHRANRIEVKVDLILNSVNAILKFIQVVPGI